MFLSTKRYLEKSETIFDMFGFFPDTKKFDVEDVNLAVYNALNHTKTLEDGIKIARCYFNNMGELKKMVKIVRRYFDAYMERGSLTKTNIHFVDRLGSEDIYHVSNALGHNPYQPYVVGPGFFTEMHNVGGKYYINRDMKYYITASNTSVDDMHVYKKNSEFLCTVHMTSNKNIVLVDNSTRYEFDEEGDAILIYEKGNRKAPLAKMKWDAITPTNSRGLVRVEVVDPTVNIELIMLIASANLFILNSQGIVEKAKSVVSQL